MTSNSKNTDVVDNDNNKVKLIKSTNDLWDKYYPSLISKTEKHSFLVDMVNGTLDIKCFQYYVIQDAIYLHHFADCLRRLSEKTNDIPSQNQLILFAEGAEYAELSLHNSFFKQWNIDVSGYMTTDQMPYTLLYTSYMKNIISSCTYEEGLAVLLPCFWVYGHVGEIMLELRKELNNR